MTTKHLLSINQLSREQLYPLFESARAYQNGLKRGPSPFISMLWFLEPSTRTRLSFDVATRRMGGSSVNVPELTNLTVSEGETLEDTLRVVSGYGDVLILRTPDASFMRKAAQLSEVPVINAGDGTNEHPTQTILDLYSIWSEFGRIDGLRFVLAVDLLHARVANSLLKALAMFDVDVTIMTSGEFQPSDSMKEILRQSSISWKLADNFGDAVQYADVIYMTRFQHHRVTDPERKAQLRSSYFTLTPEVLSRAPAHCRVFHCLTRHEELPLAIDSMPQAAYFRQARNGVFARIAIIERVLSDFPLTNAAWTLPTGSHLIDTPALGI